MGKLKGGLRECSLRGRNAVIHFVSFILIRYIIGKRAIHDFLGVLLIIPATSLINHYLGIELRRVKITVTSIKLTTFVGKQMYSRYKDIEDAIWAIKN